MLSNGKKNNLPELKAIKDAKVQKNRLVPLMKSLHRVTYLRTKRTL